MLCWRNILPKSTLLKLRLQLWNISCKTLVRHELRAENSASQRPNPRDISRLCQRNLPQHLSRFFIILFEITFCSVTCLRRSKNISMEQVNLDCCECYVRIRKNNDAEKYNYSSPYLLSRNVESKRVITKRDSDAINS